MGKWNWRLVNVCDGLWFKVLNYKYGHGFIKSYREGSRSSASKKSAWTKDLDSVSHKDLVNTHWFWVGIIRRVGDESTISFWHDNWFRHGNFLSRFKRLYNLSFHPNGFISNFGSWVVDKLDSLEWIYDKSKQYYVPSAYKFLSHNDHQQTTLTQHSHFLWKSKAPLKVTTFAWRLFQDRLPTKDVISTRGISLNHGGGLYALYASSIRNPLIIYSLCVT
ncbi:hypothetical protein Lal_00047587 [Lupinus albus]|nr:hypothetical protein Lal_00047587 [Lupinus albus]